MATNSFCALISMMRDCQCEMFCLISYKSYPIHKIHLWNPSITMIMKVPTHFIDSFVYLFIFAKFMNSFVISATIGFTAYHSESQNNVSECKILRLVCFHTFPDEKQQPTEAVAYTLSMI